MQSGSPKKRPWTGSMETLEDRLVMSADPLGGLLGGAIEHHALVDDLPAIDHHQESTPDFWIDSSNQIALDEHLRQIDQALASAHDQTGLDEVRESYGFTGTGQTVAVIDSGIAYDHYALGGGFGENYRVVGGWDFTGENDNDPYDDGPEGSHGTHVAGIIGSDDSTHEGVAPGVDLVGLRVFDDVGNGYFSWVENALDWIHTHRNSFENPITAVNLSLGVASWNSDTIPNWANLEDEFAQLEADGIFISVSAGNSFTSYGEAGLSYPAASSYVVPVMSTDDSGSLSYFSQRHERGIAAPGRWITSTVPDYSGNNNGTTDDFATFSGTSMAAPYVAGASVLIREAMEFVGYTGITQDTIYDHMVDTADSFYDSATSSWYNRLNLEAAIDALMPSDDYGSSAASAYNLGVVNPGDMAMNGSITTLDDIDYFTFTANSTGTVSFEATNTTHNLDATWIVNGPQSLSTLSNPSGSVELDVVAGQTYTLGLASNDGLGHYDLNINITAEETFSFTDWGNITQNQFEDLSIAGETWYRIVASQDGYITAEGAFNATGGQITTELYNSNMQFVDYGNAVNGKTRVDNYASTGDEFYLKVIGTNDDVDFQLTNLVSFDGTTVNISGTSGDDIFEFAAGANNHSVVINGTSYSLASIAVTNINFHGGDGSDSITMTGTSGDETAELRVHEAILSGSGFTAETSNIENATVHGGGGNDTAIFYDSISYDIFVSRSERAYMYGSGYYNDARDFNYYHAYSTAGNDLALQYDSAGNDVYEARSDRSVMQSTESYSEANGFSRVNAYASTGDDRAFFYDTEGNDSYVSWHDRAIMYGSGYFNSAYGFESTDAFSTTGLDRAFFFDSINDDVYASWAGRAYMYGEGFHNEAHNFMRTTAFSSSGNDIAIYNDSTGDDTYVSWSNRAILYGNGFFNEAYAFPKNYAYASQGDDLAVFYDTINDDTLLAWSNRVVLQSDGYSSDARNFNRVDSKAVHGGDDRAIFFDSSGDDLYQSWANRSMMNGEGYSNNARGFERSYAYSTSGSDRAIYYDSIGNDDLYALAWGTFITDGTFRNETRGFDRVSVYQPNGGNDSAYVEETDYFFELLGNWS